LKKTIIFIAFFIGISFFASADGLQALKISILSYLAHSLTGKSSVTIYLADDSFLGDVSINKDAGLKFTKDCDSAQIVVAGSLKNLTKRCLEKPIFATNYQLYQNSSVLGVLFWQKGRPVLILKKKMLLEKNLKIEHNLEKYLQ
jgi:hypothetical protein